MHKNSTKNNSKFIKRWLEISKNSKFLKMFLIMFLKTIKTSTLNNDYKKRMAEKSRYQKTEKMEV